MRDFSCTLLGAPQRIALLIVLSLCGTSLIGQTGSIDLRGTALPSNDLLDYAKHQNFNAAFPAPFSSTPVVSFNPADAIASVQATPAGFSAFGRMRLDFVVQSGGQNIPSGSTTAFALIGNRPACAFIDDGGLKFAYASATNRVLPWNSVEIDPDFDFSSSFFGSKPVILFTVGGRPAILYLKPGRRSIFIATALDPEGTGPWNAAATELTLSTNYFRLAAGEANGRPAVVYIDENDTLTFASAADATGKGPWKQVPLTNAPMRNRIISSPEIVQIQGRPAITYVLDGPGPLYFSLAADSDGNGPWQTTLVDTNAYGDSIALFHGSPVITYVQQSPPNCDPVTGNCTSDTTIKLARNADAARNAAWSITTVGPGDGGTSLTQVNGRTVVSYFWRFMDGGASGEFVAVDDTLENWLPLPDQNGDPGSPYTFGGAPQHRWLEWNGQPVLLLSDGWQNRIYSFPALTWRATAGVQSSAKSGPRLFAEAPGSPYKISDRPTSWLDRAIHLAVADWDGDGKLDVAVAESASFSFELLHGDGKGGLESVAMQRLGFQPNFIVPANLNNDGELGLIVSGYFGSAGISTPLVASFTYSTSTCWLCSGFQLDQQFPSPNQNEYNEAALSYVADVNADGIQDYVIAWWGAPRTEEVSVFLGDQSGHLSPAPGSPYQLWWTYGRPVIADLNGDQVPDILFLEDEGPAVLLSDRRGGFSLVRTQAPVEGDELLAAADLNGDGFADLVIAGSDVQVLLGNGAGSFEPGLLANLRSLSGLASNPFPLSLTVADADGDGRNDIIFSLTGGGIAVLLNDGKLGFQPAPGSPYRSGTYPSDVAVGDVNLDGVPDLIIGNSDGIDVQILLGGGNKTSLDLSFAGVPGKSYRVERTESLTKPVWEPVTTLTAGPDGRFHCADQSSSPDSFYRTVELVSP